MQDGGKEDGWDAIEHVTAEYDFREGAVPVIVILQNEEGRIPLNDTQTRDGVFACARKQERDSQRNDGR